MNRLWRALPSFVLALAATTLVVGCSGGAPSSASGGSRLEAARVPEGLRDLVPLAEKWGIGDDVDRGEALSRSTAGERAELREAVNTHGAEITAWLDSFPSGAAMPDEAAAFMFLQLAVEELPE